MLRGHMELPSETRGIAVGQEIVVLTEEEFEALEARKPQVPAEVIERVQHLRRQFLKANTNLSREEYGRTLCMYLSDLLAAVEAVPEVATPDFAAMDPDALSLDEVQALRDWLDERGQRSTWNSVEFDWSARLCDDSGEEIARTVDHFDETEALLALCNAVAAEEAS